MLLWLHLGCFQEQRRRGVIAASAGNHALALAYHCHLLDIRCVVVTPVTAPIMKVCVCVCVCLRACLCNVLWTVHVYVLMRSWNFKSNVNFHPSAKVEVKSIQNYEDLNKTHTVIICRCLSV